MIEDSERRHAKRMGLIEQIAIILGLAAVSHWLFTKLHLPAPSIMGPMIAIGTVQVLGGNLPELPVALIGVIQIVMGLSVGAKVNHKNIEDIKRIWSPSLLVAIYTLLSTAVMALLIRSFTADFLTALFSAAPGGITEMSVLALSYDTEIAVVSTFQFVRMLVILSIIPLVARLVQKKKGIIEDKGPQQTEEPSQKLSRRLVLYGIGIAGGLGLLATGFPGGGIIGAMAALGAANIFSRQSYVFPRKIMRLALIGVGITIGLEFSPVMLSKIQEMVVPIIGFSIVIVLGNILIGWVIHYFTRWDIITCLLASAPGGLSQMLVVGEEMQADTLVISILQLVRILTIIICVPLFAALIA